jgi:fatty acid desaturase
MAEAQPKTLDYRGRRLDVSSWHSRHPGGNVIERFIGQDATVAMHMSHDMRSKVLEKLLKKMDVGEGAPLKPFDADYLALEELFVERGWFTPSPLWYAYKAFWVLVLLVSAFFVPGPWLKGLFFGLFIQQSAFIAHDACHDAVVKKKRWRKYTSWFFGTVCFGLNYEKWEYEHNIHHMINSRPFEDPQMNSMPHLLYAHREVAAFEQRKSREITDWERTKMGFQYIWVLPVLFLYGRINVVKGDLKRAWRTKSAHFLWGHALHFVLWGLLLAQGAGDLLRFAPAFIVTTLAVSGIIHLQLILSHAYTPRLFEHEQIASGMALQAISNQNIRTSLLNDWFHGGLQHHIEHHLFPRLPRHSLTKVRPYVRELCEKHGLPYRSDPFFVALRDLMRSLYQQGAPLRTELSERRRLRSA